MIRDTDHPDIIISLSDTKDLGSPDEPESWHGFWNATLDIEDYLHNRLEEAIVEHREKTSDASS
jgi:hypothetical protein